MNATLSKIGSTLLCVLFSVALYAQDNNSIAGEWAYSTTAAPQGYETGLLRLVQDGDSLTGEFVVGGEVAKLNNLRKDGDAYKCLVYVLDYPVNITFRQKGDGLEGTSEVDGAVNPILFKRVNKK